MPRKRNKKRSAASLANLKPGGNLRHGPFKFARTGEIPAEHKDIGDEARRMRKQLMEEYCQAGNPVLQALQPMVINQVVSAFTFSALLWHYLWSSAARARSGDDLQKSLTQSGWANLLTSDKKQGKAFRQMVCNLKDFRLDKGKNTSLEDYLERKYGDKEKNK